MNIERRFLAEPMAVAETEKGFTVQGYAAKFNSPSRPMNGFIEFIRPGAFKRSLESGPDVVCLHEHDPSRVLGRRSAGTMTVEEDAVGLHFTCELPNTTYAKDLVESLKRGDIRGCSFGFRLPVGGDEWQAPTGDQPRARHLKECELLECSLVSIPVYPETEVALRSLQDHQARNALLALEVAKLRRRR